MLCCEPKLLSELPSRNSVMLRLNQFVAWAHVAGWPHGVLEHIIRTQLVRRATHVLNRITKWNLFATQEGVIKGVTLQEPRQEARRIGLRTETAVLKKVLKSLETSSQECMQFESVFEDCLELKA
jgi:hypothetical protein